MIARIGRMERTVGWTVSGIFNICVLKALIVICTILGITSFLSRVTEPSGWFTPSEYSDATTTHSVLWLFVFVLVLGAIAFFFNIVIAIYCFIAWVLMLAWIIDMCVSKGLRQDSYIFRFIMAVVMGFAYVPFYNFWLNILNAFRFYPEGILASLTYGLIDTLYYAGVFVLFLL